MFFTNIFSYSSRRRVCQHAFRSTLADLRQRRDVLGPLLQRHGLRLRDEVIDDPHRSVVEGVRKPPRQTEATARLRRALDDVEDIIRERRPNRRRSTGRKIR